MLMADGRLLRLLNMGWCRDVNMGAIRQNTRGKGAVAPQGHACRRPHFSPVCLPSQVFTLPPTTRPGRPHLIRSRLRYLQRSAATSLAWCPLTGSLRGQRCRRHERACLLAAQAPTRHRKEGCQVNTKAKANVSSAAPPGEDQPQRRG